AGHRHRVRGPGRQRPPRHRVPRGAQHHHGRGDGVSAVATDHLIAPHGGELVSRVGERPDGVDSLEKLTLSPRELADLDMIASGALSPLTGFMGEADYQRVVDDMKLANGHVWALPVTLAVASAPKGDRVALCDERGTLLATLDVTGVYGYD